MAAPQGVCAAVKKDGAEIGSRVPHFMERAGYYYKNWDALEDPLTDLEWIEAVAARHGRATRHWWDMIQDGYVALLAWP